MKWEFRKVTEFKNIQAEWDALNNNSFNTPLLESRFLSPLLECFAFDKLCLAICHDNNTIIAMTILVPVKFGVWQTFQPSQSPLGVWMQRADYQFGELARSLSQALPGITLNIGLTQQDPSLIARPKETTNLSTIDYVKTARVSVNSDFETYWCQRGRNLRQNLSKQKNRLKKESIFMQLKLISSPENMQCCVKKYGELESESWKAQRGTAINISNTQGKFYQKLLENYAQTGNARVYQYWYDDKLVATDLCIENGTQIIILKTTYDEAYKSTSPAQLMRWEYFEKIFKQREFERIEFYGNVMQWHTKWTDEIRTMYHVNYYPWKIIKKIKNMTP